MNQLQRYGCTWTGAFALGTPESDLNIELCCFKNWFTTDEGALGRLGHFKKICKAVTPNIEWNPWTEMRARAFCSEENWVVNGNQRFLNISNMGCSASGKTHDWSWFSAPWWLADPLNSAVILCSIQKQMIRERCWAVVQSVYNQMPFRGVGHMVDSKTMWMAQKGDNKHAIRAQAVERGEVNNAKQVIAGMHCDRMMLIIDEAPGTPEAIFEIIPNLLAGCSEFVLVTNGNAIGRLTPHGRICEPADGWGSVTPDTEIYKTAGVAEWGIKPGICIHYDGSKSPNARSGKTVYPYIYTYENWQDAQRRLNTLNYWIYDKGWFAPEGLMPTVLEESAIMRVGGMDKFEWQSWSKKCAALDPAFGTGDDPAFIIGEVGDIQGGRIGLHVTEKLPIKISQSTSTPADYQIADQVIEECNRRGIKPELFGLDATGTGRGVWAILTQKWSPNIVKVEFGGAPSDMVVSQDDPRPSKEVYDRRVTELWFNAREMVLSGQLRGLTRDMVSQFCRRLYEIPAKKYVLEKKVDYKARLGRSPDDADACVVLCEVARNNGMVVMGQPGEAVRKEGRWLDEAKKYDDLYSDPVYSEEKSPLSWFDEE